MNGMISVDTMANELAYGDMIKLKEEWETAKAEFPQTTEASGGVAHQLELIGQEYQKLYDVMTELLEHTVDFIRQTNDAFAETDRTEAEAIKGE